MIFFCTVTLHPASHGSLDSKTQFDCCAVKNNTGSNRKNVCLVLCQREREEEEGENRITSNIQFSPAAAVAFINTNALSRGAWHTQANSLWSARTHGWRLVLCSSVSWLSRPSLHKSQQACRRWKEEDAYIKANIETKALWDANIPWHETRSK